MCYGISRRPAVGGTIAAMSVSETITPIERDPREYSHAVGEYVALEYANGATLREIHQWDEKHVPAPLYVRRWRREYPHFDELMTEAEAARAEYLQEECLEIADDTNRQAAQAANAIKARQSMAAALDSQKYGNRRIIAGDSENPLRIGQATEYTDAELYQMLEARRGERGALIDGRADREGGHPPAEDERGAVCGEVRGPQTPASIPEKGSVASNTDMDNGEKAGRVRSLVRLADPDE